MNSLSITDSDPFVFIIILNWNGFKDTKECINSLLKITYKNYHIVIVDNGSDSNEIDELSNYANVISIVRSDVNLGFTGGNNLGIKYSLSKGAEFILLLNNDTTVEPDFLEPLIQINNLRENAGISAPQINYFCEPKKIWTYGGSISKLRSSGFAYSDEFEVKSDPDIKKVDFVSGCCMLIKRDVFETIGLFDEKFFLYIEDTDFCYRTKEAGYNIFVTNQSKIYHKVGSSTSEKLKQLPLYYTTRNRLYFAKKNFRGFYLFSAIYLFVAMIVKSVFWILNGNFKNIYAVKKAFVDFFKGNMGKTNHNNFSVIK